MKKRLALVFVLIAALAGLFAAPAFAEDAEVRLASSSTVDLTISGTYFYNSALSVVDKINEARAAEGIAPLTIDYELTEIAMYRAAENSIYYSHTRPNGMTWYSLVREYNRFSSCKLAENIASGPTSAKEAVNSWLNSEGHRKNIMNPNFTSVGIGRVGNVWVQIFTDVIGTGTTASTTTVIADAIEIEVLYSNLNLLINSTDELNIYTGETNMFTFYNQNLGGGPTVAVSGDFSLASGDTSILTTDGLSYTGVSGGTTQLYVYLGRTLLTTLEVTIQERTSLTYTLQDDGDAIIYWEDGCLGYLCYREQGYSSWNRLTNTKYCTQYQLLSSVYKTYGKTLEFAICDSSYQPISSTITITFPSQCVLSGHTWNDGRVTTEATCTTEGVRTYTCTKCGETKTESIAATGHSWNSGVITTVPTVTQTGVKTYTCRSCGKKKTETVAALGCPFTDLANPSTYYDAVLWAVDKGITTGATATEFKPKADCTRAQIVTFLWRYAGSPEPASTRHSFTDIKKEASYYKAVLWAVEKGITTGVDETHFCPTEPCTRAQIVTFLWRYAGKPEPSSMSHSFSDIKSDGTYYKAVLWAVEKGITTGITTTEFWPKTTCTRAQSMTFLYRYHNS